MGMRHRYKPGDYLVRCDRTGFTYYNSQIVKEWNSLRVNKGSWEPRHPQEFVRTFGDKQGVEDARPQPPTPASYPSVGPVVTTLDGDHATGATSIAVASSDNMTAGNTLRIALTNDNVQSVTLSSITDNTLTISPGLAATATNGAFVQHYTVGITATGGY